MTPAENREKWQAWYKQLQAGQDKFFSSFENPTEKKIAFHIDRKLFETVGELSRLTTKKLLRDVLGFILKEIQEEINLEAEIGPPTPPSIEELLAEASLGLPGGGAGEDFGLDGDIIDVAPEPNKVN